MSAFRLEAVVSGNYPPGVSGNEPQITGIWPCVSCGGERGERNEDGGFDACPHCNGAGVEPEEFDVEYVEDVADSTDRFVLEAVVDFVRCCDFDRSKPDERRYLRAGARARRQLREIS